MPIKSLLDVPAPGKINLFLHVLGRRPDGYHLLQSAFVLIDWHDTLHFELRADGKLQRHDLTQALPTHDLCLRAARALQESSGCSLGCDISIDKQLPSGAGMGGGSSDAASVLLALNRLWRLNWSRPMLHRLASSLGADVPFFVGGNNAWVEGIGDELTPLLLESHRLAIVKPPCHSDTSRIFGSPLLVRRNEPAIMPGSACAETAFDASAKTAGLWRQASSRADSPLNELFHGFGRNDLQQVAEAEFPEIAQAGNLLRDLFGNSRMTGSGSAVFAVLNGLIDGAGQGPEGCAEEATLLKAKVPADWSVRVCRSLLHHPMREWCT